MSSVASDDGGLTLAEEVAEKVEAQAAPVEGVEAVEAVEAVEGTLHPLSGLDSAFVSLDTPQCPMHLGAVLVLDPPEGRRALFSPATRFAQIRQVLEERVGLVPVLRRRLIRAPGSLHHPLWVDVDDFDLDDHLRRASLPHPGGRRELSDVVAEELSRPLEDGRPLWSMTVVEGLAAGRMAVVVRLHHAAVDGTLGAVVLATLLDLDLHGHRRHHVDRSWEPEVPPQRSQLAHYTLDGLAGQPARVLRAAKSLAGTAFELATRNRDPVTKGGARPPSPFRVTRLSFNGSVSSRRRYAVGQLPLSTVRMVRRSFGVTTNDVVMACAAGALRRVLLNRHEGLPDSIAAMVPISIRPPAFLGRERRAVSHGSAGNQLTGMLVSLPMTLDDPVRRLWEISRQATAAKGQANVVGWRLVSDLAEAATPAVTHRLARLAGDFKVFDHVSPLANVTISGVAGPEQALFCAGSRVSALYPIGPVADGVGLNMTTLSYMDTLFVGLVACRRLLPELDDLPGFLVEAFGDLASEAGVVQGAVG